MILSYDDIRSFEDAENYNHQEMTSLMSFCKMGDFKKIKKIIKENKKRDIINISVHYNDAFRVSCEFGHFEIAKWFFKKTHDICVSINYEYAFCGACSNGHFEIAKWLFEIKPEVISSLNERSFRGACENGHLEIAQWLLENKPDMNISANDEEVFKWTCFFGSLKVAQWLLKIKPDIDISVETFRLACYKDNLKKDNFETAQWLQSLRPWLFKIIKKEKYFSPHINTKEEQTAYFKEERFQRRKYFVWLYSSPHLHKISVLHKLPSELLREIVMMV